MIRRREIIVKMSHCTSQLLRTSLGVRCERKMLTSNAQTKKSQTARTFRLEIDL